MKAGNIKLVNATSFSDMVLS